MAKAKKKGFSPKQSSPWSVAYFSTIDTTAAGVVIATCTYIMAGLFVANEWQPRLGGNPFFVFAAATTSWLALFKLKSTAIAKTKKDCSRAWNYSWVLWHKLTAPNDILPHHAELL